jgi:rod shape-determining protein MreC
MRNLLEFLTKYNYWFVFLLLEIISFVLLFRFNSYQGSVWFSSANAVTGQIYAWNADVESFFSLIKVNEQLTMRNVRLENQVNKLSKSLADLTHDTTVVERNELALLNQYKLIPAKVISNSLDKVDNYITIDKGIEDGVKSEMGVACGNGVVGIVYMASEHYSLVIPILNLKSNISCSIKGRRYFGYLHWSGGRSDEAYLSDIPRHAFFKKGDEIETSGYSAVFPSGILVGKVTQIFNSSDGLTYRLRISLSTDFGNLRDVCVIKDASSSERIQLLKVAQDSLKVGKQN